MQCLRFALKTLQAEHKLGGSGILGTWLSLGSVPTGERWEPGLALEGLWAPLPGAPSPSHTDGFRTRPPGHHMGDPAQSLGLLSIFLCSSCVQSPAHCQHPGLGGATPLSQQRAQQARSPLPPTPESLQCVFPAGHQQWAVPGCAREDPLA